MKTVAHKTDTAAILANSQCQVSNNRYLLVACFGIVKCFAKLDNFIGNHLRIFTQSPRATFHSAFPIVYRKPQLFACLYKRSGYIRIIIFLICPNKEGVFR